MRGRIKSSKLELPTNVATPTIVWKKAHFSCQSLSFRYVFRWLKTTSLARGVPKNTQRLETEPRNALRTEASGSVSNALVWFSKCSKTSPLATS